MKYLLFQVELHSRGTREPLHTILDSEVPSFRVCGLCSEGAISTVSSACVALGAFICLPHFVICTFRVMIALLSQRVIFEN